MIAVDILARGVLQSFAKGAAGAEPSDVAPTSDCSAFCVAEVDVSDIELRDSAASFSSVPDFMTFATVAGTGILPIASLSSGKVAPVEGSDAAPVGSGCEGSEEPAAGTLPVVDAAGLQLAEDPVRVLPRSSPVQENSKIAVDSGVWDAGDAGSVRCMVTAPSREVGGLLKPEAPAAIAAGGAQDGPENAVAATAPALGDSGSASQQHRNVQETLPELRQGRLKRDDSNYDRRVADRSPVAEPVRKPSELWVQADQIAACGRDESVDFPSRGLPEKPPEGGPGSQDRVGVLRVIGPLPMDAAQVMPPEKEQPSQTEDADGSARRESGLTTGRPEPDARERLSKLDAAVAAAEAKPVISAEGSRAVDGGLAAVWQPALNADFTVSGLADAFVSGGAVTAVPEAGNVSNRAAQLPLTLVASLIATAPDAQERPVTVVLSPEELGSLRFEVQERGDTVHVTLTVERPETLDLLRRHVDQLVGEFRHAGFTGASFSFFGGGGNEERATQQPYQHLTKAEVDDPLPAAQRRVSTGLDLRI